MQALASTHNEPHWEARCDLAACFRLVERHNWHEAVANHLSLAVSDDGKQFLINPRHKHFTRIKASNLLLLDADDAATLDRPDAPDVTAWGLHGSLHRRVPHARCALHVHSKYATVLASLADSELKPIDQNTAAFFNRTVIDDGYGGMAFEEEGERCAAMFADPSKKVMIMGNHGVFIIGETVAETFNRLYYFERAAETYVTALMTGRELRMLSDEIAEKTAQEWETMDEEPHAHFREWREILDAEGSDYAS